MAIFFAAAFLGTATYAAAPAASTNMTSAAATPVANAPIKVGVINLADVLKNSPQMKAAADKLRKEFKPRQEKIMAAQKTFEANQAKLKRDAAVMSATDKTALQAKVSDEQRDLQRMQEDYMQDLQAAQQAMMQTVLKKLDGIVQSIAAKNGYDLILQRNSVAFASQRVDITPEVLKSLKDVN